MTTINFNVGIDENLRAKDTQLSPALAIEQQPTAKLLAAIAELENGETTTYESLDDFVKAFK